MSCTLTTNPFQQLMDRFQRVPRTPPPERTFMQIAGYPQLENVASNILAFYADPGNPHGLHTLILDTLLDLLHDSSMLPPQYVTVEREVMTAANKRIDLLIETDTRVIAVENKLFHDSINPFDDYRRHLEALREGRILHCVLVCLQPPPPTTTLHGFQPLMYRHVLPALRARLETAAPAAREPYVTFLRDFIQTIMALGQETTMHAPMITFFADQRSAVEGLLGEIQLLRADMQRKANDLAGLIDTAQWDGISKLEGWKRDERLFHLLMYQACLTDHLVLQININLSPTGWQINMFNAHGSRAALEAWCIDHGVPVKPRPMPEYRLAYGSDAHAYTADLVDVAGEVHSLFALLMPPRT